LREKNWQVLEAEANPLQQAVPYALLKKLLRSEQRETMSGRQIDLTCPKSRRLRIPICGRRALLGSRSAGYGQPLERSRAADAAPGDHRCRP
jgi:hypothetical protein